MNVAVTSSSVICNAFKGLCNWKVGPVMEDEDGLLLIESSKRCNSTSEVLTFAVAATGL